MMQGRILGAAFLLALPLLTPPAFAGPPSDPVLVDVSGAAQVRRSRFFPWRPASPGLSLPADSDVSCEVGCTIRNFDGNTVSLDPHTTVTIGQTTFVPLGDASAALGRRFELREGGVTATAVADPKRPRTLVIGTPDNATVALRPGVSHVVVQGGRSAVACLQGAARVKKGHRSIDIVAGEATSLSGEGGTESAERRALAPAPAWQEPLGKLDEPQPLGLVIGGRPGSVGVSWQRLRGATGYRTEIAEDAAFSKVVSAGRVRGDQTGYLAHGLREGSYFARVIAFDADGLATRPSTPVPVRVARLELPAGGIVDEDGATVVAPKGSSLRLSDPEGLEVAVDDHNFKPARVELVAVDDDAHLVRLRRQADFGRELRLKVEPRALRADVRLSSAWATWPDDPIDISVTLVDPSGRFDTAALTPKIAVLIGVEPVEVSFARSGSTLTARLAPRVISGPEVVRVIARDEVGALLGRNFLELEPTRKPAGRELARR